MPARRPDPANWYWKVGDRSPGTQVYSSAANNYVLLTDATYVAWLASGGKPTIIDTEQFLADALAAVGMPLPPGTGTSDTRKSGLFDNIPRALQVWAFAAENRLRVLEGQPTRSPAQFKTYVLNLPGW